jgi:GDP-mannose 6-dehydrogenase
MKIAIFGLGYVGTVSSACLSALGHRVFGTDINPIKVNIINQGKSPIIEESIDELICKAVTSGKLSATMDAEAALKGADAAIICVGTPNENDGSHSIRAVKRTCAFIGKNIKDMAEYPLILMRSTVIPGTTEAVVIPILEKSSGCQCGEKFGVCFNPEFLREGSSVKDFYNPPFTVIGCKDLHTFDRACRIYQEIDAPIFHTEIGVAEMVKMISNTFHALKITFANEIGKICKQYKIDSHRVMDLFCQDRKLNISTAYLRPGFAYGGSCLPKDINALIYMARQKNLDIPVIEAIQESNEEQIKAGYSLIAETRKKRIGILGFAFKEGTDDLRYSAQVELVERLIGKGYTLFLFDQNVSLARIHGANRAFIEREIPHISSLMCNSIKEVVEQSEVIVIGNKDRSFGSVIEMIKPNQIIIDLVRIVDENPKLNGQYNGIAW